MTLPQLSLSGKVIEWRNEVKHLGNTLLYKLSEEREIVLKRGDLVCRVNGKLAKLRFVSRKVIMKLFSSRCAHFYGCQAWCLDDKNISMFYTMCNLCVRRLLQVPYRTHTKLIPYLTGRPSTEAQVAGRMRKFIKHVTSMTGCVARLARFCKSNRQ